MTIQGKLLLKQYFLGVVHINYAEQSIVRVYIYVSFEPMDKILKCDHLIESYRQP